MKEQSCFKMHSSLTNSNTVAVKAAAAIAAAAVVVVVVVVVVILTRIIKICKFLHSQWTVRKKQWSL